MEETIINLIENEFQPVLLRENSKRPAFRDWPEKIMDQSELLWWTRKRRFNIGVLLGSSAVVVDRDSRDKTTWDYVRKNRLRSPMESLTASKNWHVWMRPGSEITEFRSRIRFLGLSIDILMGDRCVVMPPSEVDGKKYVYRSGKGLTHISKLPEFPGSLLEEARPQPRIEVPLAQLPDTRKVEIARRGMARRYSIAGQGGDLSLFKAACFLCQFLGFDEATGIQLLAEWNESGNCQPPWTMDRIAYKIREAIRLRNT